MDVDHVRATHAGDKYYRDPASLPERRFTLPERVGEMVTGSSSDWVVVGHDLPLPEQGWKIHVSAEPPDAQSVLDVVADTCVGARTPFKFVPSVEALRLKDGPLGSKSASGKFITVYPRSEEEAHRLVVGVSERLSTVRGPRVLTDLQWDEGPVHVRYGAFRAIERDGLAGRTTLCLRDPSGRLVPDDRRPTFSPPEWVALPPFLDAALARRGRVAVGRLAHYRIERALRSTASGGLYVAERLDDGRSVVLKEGRPHVGRDGGGRDAAGRIRHEAAVLTHLHDVEGVLPLLDAFAVDGHEFLVVPFTVAKPASEVLYQSNPYLVSQSPTRSALEAFRQRVARVGDAMASLLERVHDRGITHGDVHPHNVLLDDEDEPVLVDFEASSRTEEQVDAGGAHGFAAARDLDGRARDRHALAALVVNALAPVTYTSHLDGHAHEEKLGAVAEMFGLEVGTLRRWSAGWARPLDALPQAGGPAWPSFHEPCDAGVLDLMTAQVRRALQASTANASPGHVFPGDPRQFREGDLGLAHGAPGVLGVLGEPMTSYSGRDLSAQAARHRGEGWRSAGLFYGAAGALSRANLLSPDIGQIVLDHVIEAVPSTTPLTVAAGRAGLGLALLVTTCRRRDDRAEDALRSCAAYIMEHASEFVRQGARAGLAAGTAGLALFLAEYARSRQDPRALDLAESLVELSVLRCTETEQGGLQVLDGRRSLPYLAEGSAGLGLAVLAVLRADPDSTTARHLPGLRRACSPGVTVEAGLFRGRAGLMLFLAELVLSGRDEQPATEAALRHAQLLTLHAVRDAGGSAFAGQGSLRLSSDLATGSAGVLAALDAVREATSACGEHRVPRDRLFAVSREVRGGR